MKRKDRNTSKPLIKPERTRRSKLTIEQLERRVAPSVGDKKSPIPPPYPPGADYGVIRRDNLIW